MRITFLTLLLFVGLGHLSFSQNKLLSKPSIDILKEGWESNENKDVKKAEIAFKSIPINDTNYVLAQKELALLYMAQKNYDQSNTILTDLLSHETAYGNRASIFYILAQSYNGQEKYDKALELLDKGIKEYPMNNILYHVKGMTYEMKEDFQSALEAYKLSIQINMNYHDSHMRLGVLAANEGKYTQALLSLMSCLMIESKGTRSNNILLFMEEIADGSFNPEKKGITLSEDGDQFDPINLLFTNKVALQSKYKVKLTVSTSFARQLDMILSNVQYNKEDEGFWHQQYLSFYKKVYDAGLFDPMILYTMQSSTNEKTIKTINSKKSVLDKFRTEAKKYWDDNNLYQHLNFEGKIQKVAVIYQNGSALVGRVNAQEKSEGNWYYYFPQGNLNFVVTLNENGEKDGHIKKYDGFTNQLIEEAEYVKNVQNGFQKKYLKSGELSEVFKYKDDQLIDTVFYYYRGGQVKDVIPLKDGKRNGDNNTYYENGQLKVSAPYITGEIQGIYKTYHENGELSKDVTVEKGVVNGVKKSFYPNGQLEYEYQYKSDLIEGDIKNYYPNGKVEETGKMKAGKYLGETISYYSNGKIYSKGQYDEDGKENGTLVYYDSDGKKYIAFDYKKGAYQKIEVFDQSEKSIKTINKSGAKIKYENYYPTRNLFCEGEIVDDKRVGLWKYYDDYGVLQKTEKYVNGLIQDTVKTYFTNGQIESISQYKEGKRDGLFLKYNIFGKLIHEGRYTNGLAVNDWYEYYPDGSLMEEYAYNKDVQHGFYRNYGVNGKLENYEVFSEGISVATVYLDTNEVDQQRFGQFNGTIQLKNYTGKYDRFLGKYNSGVINGEAKWYNAENNITTIGTFVNGKREGVWKWYDFDGKIWKQIDYRNGEIHGDFIMYHENGKIASKTKYQFGKADGEQFYYYNNGNKETEATFIDDLRHGRIITYGYDGAVQQIRTYDRGVLLSYTYLDKNGKELPPIQLGKGENSFTVFYQNGNKAVEQTRFNGKIHGKYTEYYSDGKVMTEGNYYYGEENGPYLQYHPNGNKKVEENYKYGELDGVSSEYHLNGMLKKTSVYRMGELHGERKVYNEKGELIKTYVYYNDQMLEVK